jgi:HD-GYP domain-containing protein (c-di-GMP phosphodiesterase class II)
MPHSASAPPTDELLSATVEALADTLGLRDGETRDHCTRVVELAGELGRRLGLGADEQRDLAFAARVHDIGKVGVPDAILFKPGPLDELEAELLREHSGWGADLVDRIPGLEHVADIVRHHHERFDGRGYPDGLVADDIPLESRILHCADALEAMTSSRIYRPGMETERALAELERGAGTQFDPQVAAVLVDLVRDGVLLTDRTSALSRQA